MAVIISPSLLGYEKDLRQHNQRIQQIIETGITQLHVDVMREPFIPDREAFSEDDMKWLYGKFGDLVDFDFHLMVDKPGELIRTIDSIIPKDKKQNTNITIHREACRDRRSRKEGGLGKFANKEYDLLTYKTKDHDLDKHLREGNTLSGNRVYLTLEYLKKTGYLAGLALEPGTSLDNITQEMLANMDKLLLMTVNSGAGSQGYIPEVTPKIIEVHQRYHKLTIQVDGGIKEATIPTVIQAGAADLVIGSYITGADDMAARIYSIQKQIRKN